MNKTYDAIVVGAGSVGLPSAYNLAKEGLSVLVLDKRSSAGQGENKAAIGGIRATHSDPAKILLCTRSLELMSHWEEEHGMSVGWKPGGYAFPVYTDNLETKLKALLEKQHAYKLAIDWVDAETMAELIPGIAKTDLRGGTYSPNDGQISTIKVPIAYQRAAQELGTVFQFGEKVTGYEIENGKIQAVVTDKGRYPTKHLVIATGADAATDGKHLGIEIPVQPDAHEAGISAPVEHFLKPLVVDLRPGPEGKTANFYFGQNEEGQIIFCYTPKELFVGTQRESLSEFLPILASRMISLVPRLRNLLVRRIWRGCYPMTPDGIPIIDRVKQIEGLTLAVGMCGQGLMVGPGAGELVARLVTHGESTLPADVQRLLSYERDFYASSTEALK